MNPLTRLRGAIGDRRAAMPPQCAPCAIVTRHCSPASQRAGPAALDDHELLGLVGIDIDAATLAAAGGLRELLDDPDDTLAPTVFLIPAEDRARAHAVLEAARPMA